MTPSYLPVSDADRVVWLNTFSSRLGQYRVALDLTQSEIDSVLNDAAMFSYTLQMADSAKQYSQAMINLRKQLRSSPQQTPMPLLPTIPSAGNPPQNVNSGIFNRITLLVNRIRHHAAYTVTMGNDLGIITPTVTINPATMVPDFSVRLESGFPLLKWKKGDADSTNIYVDRHDNAGFVLLRHTVKSSYLDTQALPPNTYTATWDYKLRFLLEDDEVGQFSPVISINVLRGS